MPAAASAIPVLQIDAGKVTGKVSPTLYGLMTEEINYSYEGGLYGELIRNRSFMANPSWPIYWEVVGNPGVVLDQNQPLNSALNVSLKVDASAASEKAPEGIANGGYWGIPVRPDTTYRASFYAKSDNFRGPLTVALVSTNGRTIFASAKVPKISPDWQKYAVTLKTKNVQPSNDNVLEIIATTPGTIWFQQVSLFPPTFDNQPNGFRPDIMQLLAAMHPKFLRFPGGNYLEGNTIQRAVQLEEHHRPRLADGPATKARGVIGPLTAWACWNFWNGARTCTCNRVLAVYAGYSLGGQHVNPGPDLAPYVQDALEEIEYVTGDTSTKWGARARQRRPPGAVPAALRRGWQRRL